MKDRGVKASFERNARALRLRPSVGRGTAVTTVRARGGDTACQIEDGPWSLKSALSREEGGLGDAPDPGVYVRSALGSCLALGYLMWAAHMEVPIDDIEVRIETDYDASGMFGVGDVAPGYVAVRCVVSVTSPAPEQRVREMIDAADRCSPLLDDMARALPVTLQVEVASSGRGA